MIVQNQTNESVKHADIRQWSEKDNHGNVIITLPAQGGISLTLNALDVFYLSGMLVDKMQFKNISST